MSVDNSLREQNGEATAANCVVKGSFGMFLKAIKREIKSTSGAQFAALWSRTGVETPVDDGGTKPDFFRKVFRFLPKLFQIVFGFPENCVRGGWTEVKTPVGGRRRDRVKVFGFLPEFGLDFL